MSRGIAQKILIGCFLLAISMPLPVSLLLTINPSRDDYIKQRLIPPPDIAKTPLSKFPGSFQYYFEENFFLKQPLVTWNARLRSSLFPDKQYSNVVVGKNGVHFLNGHEITDFVQARKPFTTADLTSWENYLLTIDTYLAGRDIEFLVVVAPNKHDIYPELLPAWLQRHSGNTSRLVAFKDAISNKLRQPIVDLTPLLMAAKKQTDNPLFYTTDTHWNEYGAAIGTRYIFDALNSPFPTYTVVTEHQQTGGDLVRMRGLKQDIGENYATITTEFALNCEDHKGRLLQRNQLDLIVPETVNCSYPEQDNRALIFTDSFGMSAIPSLATGFSESRFVFTDYTVDPKLMDTFKPDVVIYLMVARKLQTLSPEKLLRASFSMEK